MSTRFKSQLSAPSTVDDARTVAALVDMLSGMGIARSRIDALISKASRPTMLPRDYPQPSNSNAIAVPRLDPR